MARILVVEDDADLQFLYDKVLAHQGYEVVAAHNATQAFLHLTNEDFDAVILDINMPDAPGTKVLEFVHEDVRLRDIPILVVSANEKYRTFAQEAGARYFMVKPVALQDLAAAIKDVLRDK